MPTAGIDRVVIALIYGGTVLSVAAADQLTKRWALGRRERQALRASRRLISLAPASNARGSLWAQTKWCALALWIAIAGCLLAAALWLRPLSGFQAAGLGAVAGGALGNIADRLSRGAVIDFIRIGRWPVFNLADVAICLGLAMMIGSLV